MNTRLLVCLLVMVGIVVATQGQAIAHPGHDHEEVAQTGADPAADGTAEDVRAPVESLVPPESGRAAAAAVDAAAVQGGFTEKIAAEGLDLPTAFAFVPDGRILVAQKNGVVRIVKNGALLPTPFMDLRSQVNDYWDHGLLGITVDPNFAQNGYVYLLFTHEDNPANYEGSKTGRLIRVTASGDVAAAGSEKIILGKTTGAACYDAPANKDCLPISSRSHTVGNVKVASDGSIFLTVGDGSEFGLTEPNALRAQNLDILAGKMLHVDADGKGLPGNPFYSGNPDDNRSKVWAYGLRNPFRFNLRPGTDVPYIGDVGWSAWEEINVATEGANFGWPCYEGDDPQPNYASDPNTAPTCQALYDQGPGAVKKPLIKWNHDGTDSAATGGAFYTGTTYPEQYRGKYFYADYAKRYIRFLEVDANDQAIGAPQEFLNEVPYPVDIEMGPDGNLYYVSITTGQLRSIRYVAPDSLPECPKGQYLAEYFNNITLDGVPAFSRCETTIDNDWGEGGPGNGIGTDNFAVRWTGDFDFEAGEHHFNATSDDGVRMFLDGNQIIDGWKDQGPTPYESSQTVTAGTHQVRVEYYEKGNGAVAKAGWQATAPNGAPVPTINTPATDLKWEVGQTIDYSGAATDPEDGALPASALSWDLILHHCAGGSCHAHQPFSNRAGATGSFVGPDHGEDEYYLELALTATDSSGKKARTSVALRPKTVQLTLDTQPAGLQVGFGSRTFTAPVTRPVVVGSKFDILAPSPQGANTFQSWSDGGAQQHAITVGNTDQTITANYGGGGGGGACPKGQYQAEYFNNPTLDGEPAFTRCEAKIDTDWVAGGPGGGVGDNNFSVRWTGTHAFEAGDHAFTATGDDGIRAFVDGEQVIDGWKDQGATTYRATRAMTAGDHAVRVEYYDKYGDALAKFDWRKVAGGGDPTCATGQYLAEYFDNETLTGPPTFKRCEDSINNDWGDAGPPGTGLDVNNFSVRWTGTHAFEAGDHAFTATGDDGIRAFVDGEQVIDGWKDQGATTYRATRAMTAGDHAVRVEYYDKYASAVAKFSWRKPTTGGTPTCAKGEFLAQYFDNKALEGAPSFERCETSIDNDWGATGPPGTGVGPDDFSVRWTGSFDFEAGPYDFFNVGDDGIRTFVDGNQVIDGWKDQGPTRYEVTRTLGAGTHQVRVEYYDGIFDAIAKAGWNKAAADDPPGPVGNFAAQPGDREVRLAWTNPAATDFAAVRILRSASDYATDPEPGAGQLQVYEGNAATYTDGGLANGTTYYYTAFARDAAGNWSASAQAEAAPVPPPDTTAPVVSITAGPSGTVKETSASFGFSSNESGSTFECKLDEGSYEACASPKAYSGLSDGQHTFSVRATDAAGNTSAAENRTWTLESTAPDTVLGSGGPSGLINSKSASFTFTSNKAGASFECKLDGAAYTRCTSPKSYANLANGQHTFSVRAKDALGNTDASPATRTWTVDATPPTVVESSLRPVPGSQITTRTPTVAALVRDAASELTKADLKLFLDGNPISTFTYDQSTDRVSYRTTTLSYAKHTLRIVATDKAGNATTKTWDFTVVR